MKATSLVNRARVLVDNRKFRWKGEIIKKRERGKIHASRLYTISSKSRDVHDEDDKFMRCHGCRGGKEERVKKTE